MNGKQVLWNRMISTRFWRRLGPLQMGRPSNYSTHGLRSRSLQASYQVIAVRNVIYNEVRTPKNTRNY